MQAAKRLQSWAENHLGEELIRDLLILGCIIALMVVVGPFGTGESFALPLRTFYWTVALGAGFVGALLEERYLKPILLRRKLRPWSPWSRIFVVTVFALASVLVLEASFRVPVPIRAVGLLVPSVFGVSVAVWALFAITSRKDGAADEGPSEAFMQFQSGWPAELREAEFYALSAEDHFVRIHTSQGSDLISGRFAEALEAVKDMDGAQVHRSWWVADRAVTTLDRTGGKWRLLGPSGLEVPVSRRFRPDVRAQEWDKRSA